MASDQGSSSQQSAWVRSQGHRECLSCTRSESTRENLIEGRSVAHYLLYFWELLPHPFYLIKQHYYCFWCRNSIQTENSLPGKSSLLLLQVGGRAIGNHDSYSCVAFITIGRIKPADNNTEIRQQPDSKVSDSLVIFGCLQGCWPDGTGFSLEISIPCHKYV